MQGHTKSRLYLYVRTAYRNEPEFELRQLQHAETALREHRFTKLTDNDAAVSLNYARIAANSLEDAFEREDSDTTMGEFREKAIGDIRDSILDHDCSLCSSRESLPVFCAAAVDL
jgi:hypothetical protein